MKEIVLFNGVVSTVDDENYDFINQWRWYESRKGSSSYAVRAFNGKTTQMHRLIMSITDPLIFIDHIDHNGLNNQKINLRTCNNTQNQFNFSYKPKGMSKYIGVCWDVLGNKWVARIRINGKKKYLGLFVNEIDAAKCYNEAALKHRGEFATINILEL